MFNVQPVIQQTKAPIYPLYDEHEYNLNLIKTTKYITSFNRRITAPTGYVNGE